MQPRTSHPDDFAAFVGLDWADAKHDVCLQAAGTDKPEACVLQHQPEAIEAWVSALRQRFQGQPIAIALELDKGPIVAALQRYDCLVLFPINPLTLARYREAFEGKDRKSNAMSRPNEPRPTQTGHAIGRGWGRVLETDVKCGTPEAAETIQGGV